jgi:hypothetical protein
MKHPLVLPSNSHSLSILKDRSEKRSLPRHLRTACRPRKRGGSCRNSRQGTRRTSCSRRRNVNQSTLTPKHVIR